MNTCQILMALTVAGSLQTAIAATQVPTDKDATTSPKALIHKESKPDPIANVRIGDEEKRYISAECKRFALDDEILTEDLADYLATCNQELTVAVKMAILKQRQKRKRQAEALKASRNTAGRPQPL